MEFRFSPEEEAFRHQVKRFFEQEVVYPSGWGGWKEWALTKEEWAFIRGLARKLGKKGWLNLHWPREYGGRQTPMLDAIMAEETAYYGVVLARDSLGVGLSAIILLNFASEELKQRLLPPTARGELYWCVGLSEPGAGSDLASTQTRAEERNDHFLVNGQKVWTTNAHTADWILLFARTDPQATPKHRGLSCLVVDMKTPGITVRPLLSLTGGHDFNEVFFDNVRVPKENLVGEKNRGFYMAMGAVELDRTCCLNYMGAARRAYDRLLTFVQGKGALPSHLRHRLAELAVEIEVARWLMYNMVWVFSQKQPFSVEPSEAKLFVSEMEQHLYQVGMEMLGLYSQLEEDSKYAQLGGELAVLYLHSRCRTIGDGTSEIQRNILATRGLGLPRG